jgi:hypothetical protein
VGAAAEPDAGPAKTRFAFWLAKLALSVPDEVTGDPETDKMLGRLNPTEVTVPLVLDVPAPIAVLKADADKAVTVLFALNCGKVIASGLESVNKLFPMVVAPKLLGVKFTLGPLLPLTAVTEVGVANSIQFASVDAGVALRT